MRRRARCYIGSAIYNGLSIRGQISEHGDGTWNFTAEEVQSGWENFAKTTKDSHGSWRIEKWGGES